MNETDNLLEKKRRASIMKVRIWWYVELIADGYLY